MNVVKAFSLIVMMCILTIGTAQNSNSFNKQNAKEMENLKIALKWGESTKNGDWDTFNALTSDDFQLIGPSPEPLNKEAYLTWIKSVVSANDKHDNNIELTEIAKAVYKGTVQMEGKHTRDWDLSFMGMGVIPATNKSWKNPREEVTVTMRKGKIIKCEVVVPENGGIVGILSQLGIEIKVN